MNRFGKNIVLLLLVFLVFSCEGQNSRDAVVLRVPVNVEEVTKGDIASFISLTGTLLPEEEITISSEVAGDIVFKPEFKQGGMVRKDQVIAEIVSEDYILNVRIESKKLALDNAVKDHVEKVRLQEMGGISPREVEIALKNKLDAELNYEAAKINLEKMKIKAPMSGVLAELKPIVNGQHVNQGAELGKVMKYSVVRCELNITNDDIGKVSIGKDVRITNFAFEDKTFTGQIEKISPTIDPETRTFQIDVNIENSDMMLRPGMFVRADIIVEKRNTVLRIPKYAIVTRNNRDVVFVVEEQVAKMKEVVVGIKDDDFAEIMEGLTEFDKLVVRGYETLKNNTKVRVSR